MSRSFDRRAVSRLRRLSRTPGRCSANGWEEAPVSRCAGRVPPHSSVADDAQPYTSACVLALLSRRQLSYLGAPWTAHRRASVVDRPGVADDATRVDRFGSRCTAQLVWISCDRRAAGLAVAWLLEILRRVEPSRRQSAPMMREVPPVDFHQGSCPCRPDHVLTTYGGRNYPSSSQMRFQSPSGPTTSLAALASIHPLGPAEPCGRHSLDLARDPPLRPIRSSSKPESTKTALPLQRQESAPEVHRRCRCFRSSVRLPPDRTILTRRVTRSGAHLTLCVLPAVVIAVLAAGASLAARSRQADGADGRGTAAEAAMAGARWTVTKVETLWRILGCDEPAHHRTSSSYLPGRIASEQTSGDEGLTGARSGPPVRTASAANRVCSSCSATNTASFPD